jgi:hypothetical protein
MPITNKSGRVGNATGLGYDAFPGGNCSSEIAPKVDLTQAEFSTITCRSLRAAALRECLRFEMLRIITAATTASAYLADEDDPAAIEAMRRLWPIIKTDIAIPAAELDRLGCL